MFFATPKVGHRLTFTGIADKAEIRAGISVRCLADRGAHEMIDRILKDCAKYEDDTAFGSGSVKVTLDAVVMSANEFEAAVQRAFLEGVRTGRQNPSQKDA